MNGIIINDEVYRAFEVKPQHKAKGIHRCKMCIFVIRCSVIWYDKNKPCQGFTREVYFKGSPKYTNKIKDQ